MRRSERSMINKRKGMKLIPRFFSFIADIPNSLEPRPFPTHKESTDFASDPEPKLDTDHSDNLARSRVADNTPGNKRQEALPKRVAEE